jgi:hypothetical protein
MRHLSRPISLRDSPRRTFRPSVTPTQVFLSETASVATALQMMIEKHPGGRAGGEGLAGMTENYWRGQARGRSTARKGSWPITASMTARKLPDPVLDFATDTDLRTDEELRQMLSACGCGHLFDLAARRRCSIHGSPTRERGSGISKHLAR